MIMKYLNKPVKVLAIFNSNGKIEPVRFTLDDKSIKIDKIIKVHEENIVGNNRLVFLCEQNEKYYYELKYEYESSKWYLFMQ